MRGSCECFVGLVQRGAFDKSVALLRRAGRVEAALEICVECKLHSSLAGLCEELAAAAAANRESKVCDASLAERVAKALLKEGRSSEAVEWLTASRFFDQVRKTPFLPPKRQSVLLSASISSLFLRLPSSFSLRPSPCAVVPLCPSPTRWLFCSALRTTPQRERVKRSRMERGRPVRGVSSNDWRRRCRVGERQGARLRFG